MYNLIFSLLILSPVQLDGTVVFIKQLGEPSFFARQIYKATGGEYVHVAIILYDNNIPYTYESTIPGGVQRKPIDLFLKSFEERKRRHPTQGLTLEFVTPKKPYNSNQLNNMKGYANAQLGRPYMLRGWIAEKDVKGLHCSQYVGNIIAQSGRIQSFNYKESPSSLYDKLTF